MNIGLIYATKTGHSRKIARAIAQELQIEALDIRSRPRLEGIDLLYIVGGIYGAKSAPALVAYCRGITPQEAQRAVILTSSGDKKTPQREVREVLTANGVSVIDEEFKCQGAFLIFGMGHPNAQEVASAVAFAKRFASPA